MLPELVGDDIITPCLHLSDSASPPHTEPWITEPTALVLDALGFYTVDFGLVDKLWYGFQKGCFPKPNSCESVWLETTSGTIAEDGWVCASTCNSQHEDGGDDDYAWEQMAVPHTHDAALKFLLLTSDSDDGPTAKIWQEWRIENQRQNYIMGFAVNLHLWLIICLIASDFLLFQLLPWFLDVPLFYVDALKYSATVSWLLVLLVSTLTLFYILSFEEVLFLHQVQLIVSTGASLLIVFATVPFFLLIFVTPSPTKNT